MATKTVITHVSDLSGEDLGVTGTTLSFSVNSDFYTIDLSADEATAFYEALSPYLQAGTKTAGRGVRKPPTVTSAGVDNTAVRKWAEVNGISVSPRGRIARDVIEKFKAAGN